MYTSVWEFTRPSAEIAWPPGSAELNALRESAPGFIKKEVTFENDGLVKKIKTCWESEADAMDFMDLNLEVASAANTALIQYCEDNNIFATRSVE